MNTTFPDTEGARRLAEEIVAIGALRNYEVNLACFGLAVARELIRTERECEGGEPRTVRCIGETVSARRQQIGQLSWPEAIDFAFARIFDPKERAGELSVRSRQQQQAARFGLEPRGRNKCASALANLLAN